jgi:cytochrome c-type biogenesis protein CcmH/NrfG
MIASAIAMPITDKANAQAKKDATEWIKQGRQLWQSNNISGAIAAYQQAANLEPKNSRILTSLGFLLTQQNNYSAAIAALEKATKLDVQNAKAFNALGFVYVRIKDYSSALTAYRRVIALENRNIDAYNSVGFLLTEQKNMPKLQRSIVKRSRLFPIRLKAI